MQGGHVVVQVELTLQFLATDVANVMLLPIDIRKHVSTTEPFILLTI